MKSTLILLATLSLFLANPSNAGCVKKSGLCPDDRDNITITYQDTSTTGTAANPLIHGMDCSQSSANGNSPGVGFGVLLTEGEACIVPYGQKHVIKSITYSVYVALSTGVHECLIGIATASDYGNFLIGDMAAWSSTQIGNTTTATCDEGSVSDADLDELNDWCRNTPPAPIELEFGDQYTLMVDEVSADSCDRVTISVFIERDVIKVN